MISEGQLDQVMGSTAYDRDGDKIGKVGGVFLDDTTGAPSWVSVSTGMFGGKDTLAPLDDASFDGDRLNLTVDKAQVKDAPKMDVDAHLSVEEEQELYRYYGRGDRSATTTTDTSPASGDGGYTDDHQDDRTADVSGAGHDTSGPDTDEAMTRSEERLRVGTESVETGRARLRKYVVTEDVSQSVPVSHEEVVVEREPITDANRGDALAGGELTSEEHEVTLHAERAVVAKETVPVERVRMGTETVTGEETVNAEVAHEVIETDGGTETGTDNRTDADTDTDTRSNGGYTDETSTDGTYTDGTSPERNR